MQPNHQDGIALSADRLRIAYLILTHGMPDHLGRMIEALSDRRTDFYVHVDQKVAIEPFLVHAAPNVYFLDRRVPVYWGQWQMVEATIRLIRSALAFGGDYDYMSLLSGRCYPIRSRRYIRGVLADHAGAEFINSVAMPNAAVGKTLARLERFYPRSDQSRLELVRRILAELPTGHRVGHLPSRQWLLSRDWRRALGSMAPHGGSSWWTLTGDACRHIDAFVQAEPQVIRFFENTRSADEVLFQTILAGSPFAPRIRRSLMYADWVAQGRHPAEITESHVTRFAQPGPLMGTGDYGVGEMCFARKFPDDGGRMANLVDEMVRRREEAALGHPHRRPTDKLLSRQAPIDKA